MRRLVVIFSVFVLSVPAAFAQSPPPVLELEPNSALPGASVVAKGSSFQPGTVEIRLDSETGTLLVSGSVERDGTFAIGFTTPRVAPGGRTVVACRGYTPSDGCADSATAKFTILAPPTTTSTSTTSSTSTTTSPPSSTTTQPTATVTTSTSIAPPATAVITTTTAGSLATDATSTTTTQGTLAAPPTTVGGDPGSGPNPVDFGATTTTISGLTGGTTPPSDIDLELTHIEVTQGLQNLANDFPLVAQRPTAVRLFGLNNTESQTLGSAFLEVSRDGEVLDILEAENNPISFADRLIRSSNDAAPYFILDTDWVTGTLDFRAVVIAGDPTLGNDLTPLNNFIETSVSFQQAVPVNVHMFPLYITEDGTSGGTGEVVTHTASDGWVQQALATYRLWPAGQMSFDPFNPVLGDADSGWDFATEGAEVYPWVELDLARQANGWDEDEGDLVMGMLSPQAQSLWGGFAQGVGGNTWSTMYEGFSWQWPWHSNAGSVIAQELGHNVGLSHAPCDWNPGDGLPGELHGGAIDPSFPQSYGWPNCSIGPLDEEGFYGFDVMYVITNTAEPSIMSNDPAATPPFNATPFMGYAGTGRWLEPWHGCTLLNYVGVDCDTADLIDIDFDTPGQGQGLPPVVHGGVPVWSCDSWGGPFGEDLCDLLPGASDDPIANETAPGEMVVFGSINGSAGTATLDGGLVVRERRDTSSWIDNTIDPDPLLLILLDADGEVLGAQNVEVAKWTSGSTRDEGSTDQAGAAIEPYPTTSPTRFTETIPAVPGLREVVLVSQDGVLARLAPGPGRPEVTIPEVEMGEDSVTVSWSAVDPDGDPLRSMLQYRTTGEWMTAATPGATTAVTIDFRGLPGGAPGEFRLLVSDGINQTTAVSASIELPDNRPEVVIASPIDGTTRPAGQFLELRAFAVDVEDSTEPLVTWTSDRDGAIGEGAVVTAKTLSVGRHTIVATVTDQSGQTEMAHVVVDITPSVGATAETMAAIGELLSTGPAAPADRDGFGRFGIVLSVALLLTAFAGLMAYFRARRLGPGS